MKDALFCYGTLQAPEIMAEVSGMLPSAQNALLSGYACYCLKNADYPAIIAQEGSFVKGKLYRGLDKRALSKLDRFEGEMYSRLLIRVETDAHQSIAAWAYVINRSWCHRLTDRQWLYEDHCEVFLKRFRRLKTV